jgi:long-chain acyl-CoA synthetase
VHRFPGKRLTTEASLQLDFGIDSVDWINLTLELQPALGVRLTDQAMSKVITVRDLMAAVMAAQTSPAGAPVEEIGAGDRRWLEPRGVAAAVVARCLHGLLRVVFRLVFRLRAEGVAGLPEAGPLIIAPNHVSFLDPFVLIAALPWRVLRDTYWAAWTGHMFSGPLQRFLAGIAQAIPVDPDRGPAAGLALATELLDRKKVLVWFPEGQRSPGGDLLPFTTGIGILIARTGAPVLPVHISGTYEALPRGRSWPRLSRVQVRLGRPITHGSLQAEGRGDEAGISEALRRHVLVLAGEQSLKG